MVECVVGGPGCQETSGVVVSMESEQDPSDDCIYFVGVEIIMIYECHFTFACLR